MYATCSLMTLMASIITAMFMMSSVGTPRSAPCAPMAKEMPAAHGATKGVSTCSANSAPVPSYASATVRVNMAGSAAAHARPDQ